MWQYITRVQINRQDEHGTKSVWIPITFRGPAGRIWTRDRIQQEALSRAGRFLETIRQSEEARGRTDTVTGTVQIVGVVFIK